MSSALALALLGLSPAAHAQVDKILHELRDPSSPAVLVAAHRSDWRNAPENSLAAMERAIRMGVDILEVDVRRTKDGRFVIMHDTTLDRTTTGKGLVSEYTLAEIKNLHLLAATGHPTDERVPTLEEALDLARGRAIVNLDKSFEHPDEILAAVEADHALDYALFTVNTPYKEFTALHPGFVQKAMFMVWADLHYRNAGDMIDEYLEKSKPVVVQVIYGGDSDLLTEVERLRHRAAPRLWIDAMWPEESSGHDDERALHDPDGAYGWLIAHGVGIIQTDRPQYLIDYLSHRNA
ncbi:MAG TPA: glycerophosphodiester phosphodiesterase family protein, partial [Opitutaceae bacterium]|nr:glycerophosphodiester phosphodiesterase family protein [Opitutaceae bacterium]